MRQHTIGTVHMRYGNVIDVTALHAAMLGGYFILHTEQMRKSDNYYVDVTRRPFLDWCAILDTTSCKHTYDITLL